MRVYDINEGPVSALKKAGKKFQQDVAKGFTRTQTGGSLAPDAFEKGIKNFFTNTGNDDKKSKDEKPKKVKGGAGTDDAMKTAKPNANKATTSGDKDKPVEPTAPSKGDDFPVGYAGGEKYKVKPGDTVDYTNAKGQERQAKVTKLLDTRDKDGDLQIQLSLKGATFALDRKNISKVNGKDWKFTESKEETMNKAIEEGLADLASRAEADHEVQMARADLYKIAKYAIKLHDMLKGVSEAEGLEGWQQAKITKASDYISSVYHNLDYDMKFGEAVTESKSCNCDENCPCGGNCGPNCNCHPGCGISEGKSPHKKGSAKYKKHMAAKHASMSEDEYKASIAERLNKKLSGK